jgi:prephenate dehydratase
MEKLLQTSEPIVAGYQGEPGAFSDRAAHEAFGEVVSKGYATFTALLSAVESGEVQAAMLPCVNTIAGRIATAREALASHPRLQVAAKMRLRVEQCLIGTPDAKLAQVHSATSHPVAIEQCRRFFAEHPDIAARACHDTAGAVRGIMEKGDPAVAAIASAFAAERYGARVLLRGIQDWPENFTTFWLVCVDELAGGVKALYDAAADRRFSLSSAMRGM